MNISNCRLSGFQAWAKLTPPHRLWNSLKNCCLFVNMWAWKLRAAGHAAGNWVSVLCRLGDSGSAPRSVQSNLAERTLLFPRQLDGKTSLSLLQQPPHLHCDVFCGHAVRLSWLWTPQTGTRGRHYLSKNHALKSGKN